MKRKTATRVAAATAAILALAGPVTSADAKAHKYTANLSSAPLSTAYGFPAQGGTALFAGTLETNAFGTGALVDHLTVTGNPQPNVITFKGTEVDFYVNGTLRNKFTATDTIAEDGSQHLVIKGKFTGGTGRYRNATGSYEFTGGCAPGSTTLIGISHGKVLY